MKNILFVLTLVLGMVSNADAVVMLDQYFDQGRGSSFSLNGKAQTFTVGKAGVLDSVSLGLYETSRDTTLYILPVLLGIPATDYSTSLASLDFSGLDFGTQTWVNADLRAFNIAVNEGDELAVALAGDVKWGAEFTEENGYPSGEAFYRTFIPDELWKSSDNRARDYNFRTYVDVSIEPNAIPEPATMALFGIGAVGAFWRRKRSSYKR